MTAASSWSGRRKAFPAAGRRAILERDPICVVLGCNRRATIADHRIPLAEGGTDDLSYGQGMCSIHHDEKSEQERLRGLARRSNKRTPERHPGLNW